MRFFFSLLALLLLQAGIAHAQGGDSYVKAGNAFYHARQWDKAIEQYRLSLKINPDHLGAMHNLGLAYQSKRDFGKAIRTFSEIKKMDRLYVPAYISLGLVYTQKVCYREAQREYTQAIALEPDNLVAHLNLAVVLAKQKQFAGAFRAAQKGLVVEPSSPHLHLLIANVYFAKQKYFLAKLEYVKALRLQPDMPSARIALALTLAHLGDYGQALEQIEIAKKLDADHPEIPRTLGKIFALQFRAQQKGGKEAVKYLRAAASSHPEDTEICRELADVLALKAEHKEARKWYRRILENPRASQEDRRAIEAILLACPKEIHK